MIYLYADHIQILIQVFIMLVLIMTTDADYITYYDGLVCVCGGGGGGGVGRLLVNHVQLFYTHYILAENH